MQRDLNWLCHFQLSCWILSVSNFLNLDLGQHLDSIHKRVIQVSCHTEERSWLCIRSKLCCRSRTLDTRIWYNSVSTRKERARKGADNDSNGVGLWAFMFCMPGKLCTPMSADEVLETCLAAVRGQFLHEYLPCFYIPLSLTWLGRTRAMQYNTKLYSLSTLPISTGLSFPLLSPSFIFSWFCLLLSVSLIFLYFFSLLEIPSMSREAKDEVVLVGCLVQNKHWVALWAFMVLAV